ncbi:hypothetical protein M9Y10_023931 [Tritrichomonas musculus]|uniref:EF-hand domain-containing protein n=1 Tax=Tritrichomonas musculus TaxID=1915356 RepID=A0ABR2KWI5_9EUKA
MDIDIYKSKTLHFTQEQLAITKQIFDHFDENKDGKLNFDEAKKFMLKYDIDQIFFPIAFEICDINKDKLISFEEFKFLFMLLDEVEDTPSIIYKNLFDKFDKNDKGFLEGEEIKEFLKYLFKDITEQKLEFYLQYFDKNQDGKLDFDEITVILDIINKKRY